jgi:hypothetical protein
MRTLLFGLLLAVFALSASADTEVTGKWSGSFNVSGPNGEGKDGTAYLVLKQSGSDITGTVGPNEDEQYPIVKGKIEGDKITIEVNHDGHAVKLALVLAEDRITGDANMSGDGGEAATAKLDVKRVK